MLTHFVISVSASHLTQVKSYIRNQKQHHKKLTFEEEFISILKKAGVDYNPSALTNSGLLAGHRGITRCVEPTLVIRARRAMLAAGTP